MRLGPRRNEIVHIRQCRSEFARFTSSKGIDGGVDHDANVALQ